MYDLIVPVPDRAPLYEKGTAFVAEQREHLYLIHYEKPGTYSNVITLEDRIRHAAGRLQEDYPTSKMMGGRQEDWIKVGTVSKRDNLGWYIDEILDHEALNAWDPGPHYEGGSPELHEKMRIKLFNQSLRKGRL